MQFLKLKGDNIKAGVKLYEATEEKLVKGQQSKSARRRTSGFTVGEDLNDVRLPECLLLSYSWLAGWPHLRDYI